MAYKNITSDAGIPDLKQQIQNIYNSDYFKKEVATKQKNNEYVENVSVGGLDVVASYTATYLEQDVQLMAKKLEDIFNQEVSKVNSDVAKIILRNSFKVDYEKAQAGWTITLEYNESVTDNPFFSAWRPSVSPAKYSYGAFLPTLFAMGYQTLGKRYIDGYNFVEKTVEKMRKLYPNVMIEYNAVYGGSLPREDVAYGIPF